MPRALCDGWEAGTPVIFSLLLLFYYPQLAERGFECRDLLVMHVTEGRQLKLTILDETARAGTHLRYAGRILLLPRQRISFAPTLVARIAQGGAPSSRQISKARAWITAIAQVGANRTR